MIELSIAGGAAVFLVLAILLLSLNLASLWRWWIKAGAIVVTLAGIVVLYFICTGLIGWANPGKMPTHFSLLSTRIVEPDKITGAPGHIYLWIEEVDDRQIVISPPRAFEVPYKAEIATNVATAQSKIDGGGKVLGEVAATGDEEPNAGQTSQEKAEDTKKENGSPQEGAIAGGGEGAETIGDTNSLTFTDMPVPELPDKGVVQVGQ